MPRLRVFSGKGLCDLLRAHGFEEARRRGSHAVMQRMDAAGTTTIPVPMHRELRTGTLRSIIRQSGLDRQLFEA